MSRDLPDAFYCSGKRAYDKRSAMTAANFRYKKGHIKLRIYPCADHWHLTKKRKHEHV